MPLLTSVRELRGFLDDYYRINKDRTMQAHRIGLDLLTCRAALEEVRDALAILPEDSGTYEIYRNVLHALSPHVDAYDNDSEE